MHKIEHLKSLNIVLDSCIFIDLTQKHFRRPLASLLIELKKNNNRFYYSQYSNFELLKGRTKKEASDYKMVLEFAFPIPVDEKTLIKASDLVCAYKHNRIVTSGTTNKSKNENKIDDGDYIIGATAFQYKQTCILTRNSSDFPRPFFVEIGRECIDYKIAKKKKLQGCEVYYILEPDVNYEYKIFNLRN